MPRLLFADLSLSYNPGPTKGRWRGYAHRPGLGRYAWVRLGPVQLGLEVLLAEPTSPRTSPRP